MGKRYKVMTGTGIEYFDTREDSKIFAKYIDGVVLDTETETVIYDYYNLTDDENEKEVY